MTIAGGACPARSARHTSSPPVPGSIRSSTTGVRAVARAAASRALSPSAATVDPVAGVAEVPGDDVANGRVVVHHEHAVGHLASVTTRTGVAGARHRTVRASAGPVVARGPTVDS